MEGGIDSVTTGEEFWLNPIIGIGDTTIYYTPPPMYSLVSEKISYEPLSDYEGNISYLLMEKKYGNGEIYLDSNDVRYVESSWFTIDRPDKRKIIFSVSKNEIGEKRNFGITLRDGNCADIVDVIQSAE